MANILTILACVLMVTPTGNMANLAEDNKATVQAFLDAHNEHNVDAVLALCTDDVVWEEEGISSRSGKAELRKKELWDKAVNGAFEFRRIQARGNVVTAKAVEFSDYYAAAGIDQFEYDSISFTFQGSLIKEIKVVPSGDSNNAYGNALNMFVIWGSSNKAAEMNSLKEGGRYSFSAATAPNWIKLLKEWKASTGS